MTWMFDSFSHFESGMFLSESVADPGVVEGYRGQYLPFLRLPKPYYLAHYCMFPFDCFKLFSISSVTCMN